MVSVVLQEGRLKGNGSTQNVDTRNMTDLLYWVVGFSTLQLSVEDRPVSKYGHLQVFPLKVNDNQMTQTVIFMIRSFQVKKIYIEKP